MRMLTDAQLEAAVGRLDRLLAGEWCSAARAKRKALVLRYLGPSASIDDPTDAMDLLDQIGKELYEEWRDSVSCYPVDKHADKIVSIARTVIEDARDHQIQKAFDEKKRLAEKSGGAR